MDEYIDERPASGRAAKRYQALRDHLLEERSVVRSVTARRDTRSRIDATKHACHCQIPTWPPDERASNANEPTVV